MTRINCAIEVESLTDEHLRAEHREIKRITLNFMKRVQMNKFNDIPKQFTLNTGHVLFFIDKGKFTFNRYLELHNECFKRGFKMTDYSSNWDVYQEYPMFFNDYVPTKTDKKLLQERISERLKNSKQKWHYYGNHIEKDTAIDLLKKAVKNE